MATINGTSGNDFLTGLNGPDVINAGDGDDYINVRAKGSDTVDGGNGLDRVSYYQAPGPLNINLETGIADDGSGTPDTLLNVERINGNNATADVIIGRADTNETLYGNGGDDTLDGGAGGSDTTGYSFTQGAGVTVNLALGTSSGIDGVDVLINFENIEGSNYNDALTGDNGANILWGLGGDDLLTGGGGNDTLFGGAGNDRAVYTGNKADYTLTTLANGDVTVQDNRGGAPDGSDTLRGVKTLQFADGEISMVSLEHAVSSVATGHQVYQVSAMLLGTGGNASNGFVQVFRGGDGSGDGIYVRRFDGDGTALGNDVLVNTTTTGDQRAPTVTALADGGFVVIWDSVPEVGVGSNLGTWEVRLQRFDAGGATVGGEVLVNTTTEGPQRFPSIVSTADGGYLAVWQSDQEGAGGKGIYGQKFDASGTKTGVELHYNTTTSGDQISPLVRAASYNEFGQVDHMVVAWLGQAANGGFGVMQQLTDANGVKIGAEQIVWQVSSYANLSAIHQTQLDQGYVLTWTVTPGDGGPGSVMARVFDNNGAPTGAAFVAASGEQYYGSDVISLYDGNFMLVWDVQHADGSSAIVGRHFNSAGGPVGDVFIVTDHMIGGAVTYPTVSASGNGDIVVSWTGQGNDILIDSGGVYQQLVNGNGEFEFGVLPIGAVPAGTTFTVQTVAGGDLPQTTPLGQYVLNGALSSGATTGLHHLALSGVAVFGTTVTIMSGATELVTVGVDDEGRWAADLKQLGDGVYHLQAVVKDVHGNASAPSAAFDLTVQTPAVIDGTSGADTAQYWFNNGASGAAQTLNGGDGNDTLNGGGGNDTLNGGAGDDTYLVRGGETVSEAPGAGIDTIVSAYGVNLADNVENLTVTGNASTGLFGNGLDNVLRGGAGGDYIEGGGGNDTLYGNAGGDNFSGSAGNDVELGGDGDDFFIGGEGNDLMDGGAGRDFFNLSSGRDTVLGGDGDADTLYTGRAGITHGVSINLATDTIIDDGFGETGSISGIEEVEGTQFADKLIGGAAGETFTSHGGNDTIDGGAGFDGLIYGGAAAFTGSLATGIGNSADGAIQFSNIEALGGGSGNDSLTGNSGNNVLGGMQGNDILTGGGGNDTIYGGGGADTAVYAGNKANYTISTVNGVTTVKDNRAGSPDGIDSLEGVRTLKFADGNVELKAVDQIVSSNTGGFQIYQSTAANWYRDDGFLQVFRAADGNGHGLYARLFDSDGHALGGDILINANNIAGDQRAPVVSSLVFGGYAVAYHSNAALDAGYADAGWDVMVQVLGVNGQPLGAAVNVGTTPGVAQRLPTVTGLDFGGFVVTWQSAQAGNDNHLAVYARSFGSDGQPTGPEVLVGMASDSNQSGPAITSQADGGYVIAWSGITPSGHYGHMEQRFDAGGGRVGAEQVVFDTATYAATLSVVHTSRMADGGHVLSWVHDADGEGSGDDVVMARHYDGTGNPTGAAFVVASAGAQASATVLGLSDGSYMVVWDVENADGSSAIMGRRYSGSNDSALTAEFKISNSPSAGVKLFPTLAEFQNGQIVVSWGTQGMLALTDSGGIYQQIIDFNGLPLFYAGDSSATKPAATTLTVQTVVGGAEPVLDPAYLSAAYYLKDPALSSGASVSNSHLVISGTAAAGSVITVKAGTTVLGTAAVDDDGRWALDVKSLATGAYALTATVTDLFGKVSAASPAFNLTINNGITGTAGDDNEQYWVTRGANGSAQSLTGLAGNDTLNGGGGNDTLTGGAGDDVYIVNNTGVVVTEALNGGSDKVVTSISLTLAANVESGALSTNAGATLTGNALANVLEGGDGNDVLNGLAGSDTMWGGAGDDTFVVDVATDVVEEGKYAGKDTVQVAFAAAGTYTLDDENVENAIITGTAAINVVGNDADNLLTGNAVGNVLSGGLGSDTLNGMAGNDTMNGGDGDYGDTYVVDALGDVINEIVDGGIDTVQTALASYVLNAANVENLVYTGAAAFNGTGNAGNNEIKGGVANDTLSGGAGNDTLVGAAGNDSLLGGDGDDVLKPSGGASGVDVVDGGAGADTVVLLGNYADFMRSRVTDTDTKLVNAITGETVTVRNVEQVQFADGMYAMADLIANSASPGADTIVGTEGNDSINAGAGADLMIGGMGNDTYYVDNKDDVIQEQPDAGKDVALVNLAAAGTYTLAANVEEATVTSAGTIAVNLIGNAGNNTLVGNAGANLLVGNEGDDTLVAGAGTDTLVGGTGDDDYLVDSAADVITETADGGIDTVVTGVQSYTLGAFVENLVYLGGGGINATGNALDNTMSGWEGNDTLNGDAGNDELSGNLGNDNLLGGAGDDLLLGEQGNDTLNGGIGNDMLEGGAGNDSLLGGDGDDLLLAGVGIDVADGGVSGDDMLELLGDYDSYTITRPNATDVVLVNAATGESITARNIEQFAFADGIKTYGETILNTYSAFGDALEGSIGIDSIDGLGGSDTMAGLDGDDIYVVDVAGDVIVENADEGIDLVQVKFTAVGTYVLGDEVENATVTSAGTLAVNVTGNDLDNILTGNAGANKLTGNGGNDQLVGGAGNDTMAGGDGDDLYVVDAAGDVVIEAVEAGWDMVETSLAAYTLAANVEDLKYTGNANFAGTGNALDNDIRAGAGNDTLNGGLGDDYLVGNEGSDSLLGGDGNDMLFAGTGANDFVDGGAGDNAVQLLGNFADYTRSRVSLTDTKLVNALTGESVIVRNVQTFFFDDDEKSLDDVNFNLASTGDDVLEGTAGNDSLNGLAGKDTMSGLDGDDIYVVDVAGDQVFENADEGDDLVNVAFTAAGIYTLSDNVERATVTSTLAVGLVGNALNNILTGNAAANTLSGNAGNDTLVGGAGSDTMIGGDGNDVYAVDVAGDVVTEGAGVDSGTHDEVQTTLAAYTLAANVEWLVYKGTGNFNGTGNAGNNVLSGGNGNDTLNGGLGDDYLTASGGNDSMAGGDGNDTMFGGGGNDIADGGAGDDTVEFLGNFNDYSRTRISATETRIVDLESGDAVTVRNVEHFVFQDGAKTLAQVNFNLASVGDDALLGTSGNDSLNGLAGKDTMTGLEGNDTYYVDVAGDVVVENPDEGTDLVNVAFTAAGSYTLGAGVENATITSTLAVGVVGNELNNILIGNSAANTLTGNGGNDRLIGGAGSDTMVGGTGDDIYIVDAAGDVVTEGVGAGVDTVHTSLATYTLAANVENLFLDTENNVNFNATGNALDNEINGESGKDTLSGGAGNDTLRGNSGNDSLMGGDGDDLLDAGEGTADVADGGAGSNDTLLVEGSFEDFVITRVTLTDTRLVSVNTGESVTIRNIENVLFDDRLKTLAEVHNNVVSVGDDVLHGTAGNDSLNGLAGKDTMSGLDGDDTYFIDVAGDLVIENADEGDDLVNVGFTAAGSYTLTANVENATVTSAAAISLVGNAEDNTLTGNAAANTLTGNAGNDRLIGGAGSDTMIGGEGDDVYVVDAAGDVVTEAGGGGDDAVETTLAAYTLAANVEMLGYIGAAAFNGTGNALANEMAGGVGNDTLNGGLGNDTLFGGSGNDSLLGGDGDDDLYAGTGTADVADGGAGSDTLHVDGVFAAYTRTRLTATDTRLVNNATGESITIRNIESVIFDDGLKTIDQVNNNLASAGNDTLIGTAGADTLNGGAGADDLSGGDGNDTYVLDVAGDVVHESIYEGVDLVQVAFTAVGVYTLTDNVENATVTSTLAVGLVGNTLGNVLTGNAAANKLSGGDGNDTLVGGAGTDVMIGGSGDDVYVVDVAADVVTELDNAGNDRVETALATYTLGLNVEVLAYTGAANFTGNGNALANEIYGRAGNDTLNGGLGNDSLGGGAGNDSLLGGDGDDGLDAGTGVTDVVDGGLGNDTLFVQGNFAAYTRTRVSATDTRLVNAATGESITFRGVETVNFADGDKTLAEVHDNLVSAGNDVLTGTAGIDSMNGLAGNDTMSGLAGNDTYIIDAVGDVVIEAADEGTDQVNVGYAVATPYTLGANVENATVTSTAAIALVGNALDNVLTGNAAANTLTGNGGNDTLSGGAGSDTMTGGLGNDVYVVDAAGDVVFEDALAGMDRVDTTLAAYTLGAAVENLNYLGAAAFKGTGNALDNVIVGGSANDTLSALAGNDTLTGGGGNDTLTGGADADTFVFNSLTGVDTITDFVTNTDKIAISQAVRAIGDGDTTVEDAVLRASAGGFSADAELVVFSQNTAATISNAAAAAVIGSATGNYTLGQQALFVVDNGTNSYVYVFKSSGTDALVSAAELTQVAILTGNSSTALTDFQFV